MKIIETVIEKNPSGKIVYHVKDLLEEMGIFKVHRSDGPAIMYEDGKCGWYWEGNHCFTFDQWCKYAKDNSDITEEEIFIIKLTYGT